MPNDPSKVRNGRDAAPAGMPEFARAEAHLGHLSFALDQHAIVATTDAAGRITFANQKFCELSGYALDELLGQDHRLLNSGYHPKAFFQNLWRTISEGHVWRGAIRNRAKDGHFYWVASTIVPFKDEHGEIVEYVAIRTDITEHRESHGANAPAAGHESTLIQGPAASPDISPGFARTQEQLEHLGVALDHHAIVATTDTAGRITFANQKFCELSGYALDELLGEDHRLINSGFHPKSFFDDMWRTIGRGQVWRGAIRNRAKDGHFYWVASTIVPFKDEHGKIVEYVAIRTDITEHRETAQRLAEMYETAHRFVDHVSHEFRTPLTVIREFASIIGDGLAGETNDEQREYLGIIVNRVDDLSVLVDDMLDTSKLEAGLLGIGRADCRIEEIVGHIRTTLERRAVAVKAHLAFEIPPDLPAVYCDAEKIGRVITNLVINALKFCGQPGAVTLSAEVSTAENELTVSVTDNGSGIAPENLEALFQRFRQVGSPCRSSFKGFGLGLSIAKELVSLNFGDITVRSEQGSGSTFAFTIPLAERRSLLQRYVRRIEELRNGITHVALLQLTSEQGAAAEALEDLEYLVQRDTRRGDLLFRTAPHRWLLVSAVNQEDLQPMIERIRKGHAEAQRNRSMDGLPTLTLGCVGSWDVRDEVGAFVEGFMATAGTPEPACV